MGGKNASFYSQCHDKESLSFIIFTLSAEEQGLDPQLAENAGMQYITHTRTHPPLLAASFICPINASYTPTTSSAALSARSALRAIWSK